ncbi:MAG: hypothetical protein AB7T10_04480 [bacterium]
MRRKNIIIIGIVTVSILLVPLVAMRFVEGVDWTLFDFIAAGGLLFCSGLAYEILCTKATDVVYRSAVGLAVAGTLLLIWINLAVGIIGDENNPINAIYLLVILVEFIGLLIAQFNARGMKYAMFVTAAVQAIVTLMAFIIGQPLAGESGTFIDIFKIFILNSFFVTIFTGSAILFNHSDINSRKLKS